jgi:glycosyltransferase involved in cell wall biosynthesis
LESGRKRPECTQPGESTRTVSIPSSAVDRGTPRVLFAANTSWYLFNYYRNIFLAFREAGYDVYVASPRDAHAKLLTGLGCRHVPLPLRPHSRNPIREAATLLSLFAAYRRIRPAIAFHFTIKCNLYGGLAARALSIPHANNVSGLGSAFNSEGVFNRAIQSVFRVAQRRCARVFFQNVADLEYMEARKLVSPGQAMLLPGSGVNLAHFLPAPPPRDGNFTFVFAGRLLWEKGLAYLADALRELRAEGSRVRCLVFGFLEEGNPKFLGAQDLAAWEAEGLLEYRGPLEDVKQAYRLADCVILPTYYREGIPKSLLEAMAMTKPVLATDIVGCRQAVTDGENGFLCAPRNAAALADAMRRMANLGEDARARMGLSGRHTVEARFGEDRVIGEYLKLANDLTR